MPTRKLATNVQTIEVGVTGPEDANRMFITTGMIKPNFVIRNFTGITKGDTETYTALIDPPLGGGQFRRSIAIAAFKTTHGSFTSGSNVGWSIREVEADFDDESAKVELRVTIQLSATNAGITIEDISFQVTTLAKVE